MPDHFSQQRKRDADSAELPPREHPAEPDHPMLVEGGVIDGDTALMFRCMVEEYLLAGNPREAILAMCDQSNYQALHAAMHTIGRNRAASILSDAAARVGCLSVRVSESKSNAQSATLTISSTMMSHEE